MAMSLRQCCAANSFLRQKEAVFSIHNLSMIAVMKSNCSRRHVASLHTLKLNPSLCMSDLKNSLCSYSMTSRIWCILGTFQINIININLRVKRVKIALRYTNAIRKVYASLTHRATSCFQSDFFISKHLLFVAHISKSPWRFNLQCMSWKIVSECHVNL